MLFARCSVQDVGASTLPMPLACRLYLKPVARWFLIDYRLTAHALVNPFSWVPERDSSLYIYIYIYGTTLMHSEVTGPENTNMFAGIVTYGYEYNPVVREIRKLWALNPEP